MRIEDSYLTFMRNCILGGDNFRAFRGDNFQLYRSHQVLNGPLEPRIQCFFPENTSSETFSHFERHLALRKNSACVSSMFINLKQTKPTKR